MQKTHYIAGIRSDRDYIKQLHDVLDKIFDIAYNEFSFSAKELAREAGLSINTVYKLEDRITILPHFRTVVKLANAVGWKLSIVPQLSAKSGARIKIS